MPWSPDQIKLAHVASSALKWDRSTYELLLRNVAGVRPHDGKISSKNASATNAGFERLLAFAESQGWEDIKHGPNYWQAKAREECRRVHRKIELLWAKGSELGLLNNPDGLPAYVLRMTAKRQEGPTNVLAECDGLVSYQILEGLKAWLFTLAKRTGKTINWSQVNAL